MTKYPREHTYGEPYYCTVCDKEVTIQNGKGFFGSENGGFYCYVMAHYDCITYFRKACRMDKTRESGPIRRLARQLYRKEMKNVTKEQGKV